MADVIAASRAPARLVDRFGRWGFDLDGTVWRGATLLPYAREVLAELRRLAAAVAFFTNNGSVSATMIAAKLSELGIDVDPSEVVTSGRAARRLLADRGLAGATAYVVGGSGLRAELEPLGLEFLDEESGERADAVIVTRDEDFSYARMRTASRAIARGALFVATNRDLRFPVEEGFWPGGGAVAAAVAAAAGGAEPLVAGKPEPPFLREAESALPGDAPAILVGDRPASDLESARRLGWTGALVLTGVSTAATQTGPQPDIVLRDLSELLLRATAGRSGAEADGADG